MPHNPVQIVLNSRDYLTTPDPGRGGSATDFFAGRDDEFVQHRTRLARQVASIGKKFQQSGVGTGFVKVKMRKEAWAKSHRPIVSLFPPQLFSCVGGSGLGELFYQVTEPGLNVISEQISAAEPETRWKSREVSGKNRTYAAPSKRRSEVGAIESISVLAAPDKRKFSTETAVRWLSNPRTSGAYLVELFRPHEDEQTAEPAAVVRRTTAIRDLERAIRALGLFAEVFPIQTSQMAERGIFRTVGIRLVRSSTGERPTPVIFADGPLPLLPFDSNVEHHSALLEALDRHMLVRRIGLPPVLLPSHAVTTGASIPITLPEPQAGTSYPKVGVIDGGIGSSLSKWIIGRNSLVAPEHQTLGHGTFIGGLLVGGRGLNGDAIAPESDGCELYDIAIFPDGDLDGVFENYYPRGVLDFLEEISISVDRVKQTHGIRIFNLSLNLFDVVEENYYSDYAEILDQIADAHDVVFVLSAGNLESADYRPVWPGDPRAANQMLAARTSADTLLQPTESSRSIAVGALNPPGVHPHIAGTPTCYSRRGPGLKVGIKPDFAHYGGSTPVPSGNCCTGLLSVDPSGLGLYGLGTSFATPLVSKTLAALDAGIEGYVSRETLFALAFHHARIPASLNHKDLRQVARQFVGFGVPCGSEQMLVTDDYAITLVFADTLKQRKELQFDFVWPRCLVTPQTGACRGSVRMTVVYRSVLKAQFGAEFVRVNVDAHLRQAVGDSGHYKGQLGQSYLPNSKNEATDESELIEFGLKWWPIKVYERRIPKGVGRSSAWRLVVDSLTRADQIFPPEGVPFAVILTIADPEKDASKRGPVFQQLRQDLLARQVQMMDIRTANRVRPRA